jgi:hypothetical protein
VKPRLGHGRQHTQIAEVSNLRSLSRADLVHLTEKRGPLQTIQVLRDTHHRVARAVAAGLPLKEVAELCGRSYAGVRQLTYDPAFKELVAHYRGVVTAEFIAAADPVIDYMRTNALKAQAMLSDKLDKAAEENEFLPTRDLLGIAELGLDRTGYGKVNKNVNVNVDFAASLEAARKRSASVRTIEASSHAGPQSPPSDMASPPARERLVASPFRRL